MYPSKFEDLIYAFHRLPGVGMKTAERYAFAALNWSPEVLNEFIKSVKNLQTLQHCRICGNISDGDKCSICNDTSRNQSVICVVENPKNLSAIENMNSYTGTYHVLNGVINSRKGVLPDQLNINSLEERVNSGTIDEVILALDPTVEGETTSLYLEKLLGDRTRITRLANGIPIGSQLEYADTKTLQRAFENRN